MTRGALVLRRFRRNRLALAGLAVLVFLFLAAYAGPYFLTWKYTDIDVMSFGSPPTGQHWFGTTQAGQDLLALTLRGLQKSLVIGLLVGFLTTLTAALIGSFAGYYGGWPDAILSWFTELLLVLPSFLVIAVLSPDFKGSTWLIFVLLLTAFGWMITSKIIKSSVKELRRRDFVTAAKYMGISGPRIILRHILPNLASLLIIDCCLNVSAAVLAEAGLSYFGFGIQAPDVSLGTLIAAGASNIQAMQWTLLFPVLTLVLLVLSVNFIGDGLRDALDPNSARAQRRRGKKASA